MARDHTDGMKGAYEVMRRYGELNGRVHADTPEILTEIEDILDENFTLVVAGKPEWTKEQLKSNYPPFRRMIEGNGGLPASAPVTNMLNPLFLLDLETPLLPGKLFHLMRFTIPSANPAIPFASVLSMMAFDNEKVLWERLTFTPVGADAPTLENLTVGFNNEENLQGIHEYGAAWASGDMDRLLRVLHPVSFTLGVTWDAQSCSETSFQVARDAVPSFYENYRKRLEERGGPDCSYADYRKVKKITTKEVDSLTFVGEEYEDLVSYTVSLSVFQMGLCIGATSSITPKEGPWSVAVTTAEGERTTTMEYEAKTKGQDWVNHAYEIWMEHTGKSEDELQQALKDWNTIDESPGTVEQMEEAQNWVTTFFATGTYITLQDQSFQPPLRNVSHPKGIAAHGTITFEASEDNMPSFAPFKDGLQEKVVCVFAAAGFAAMDDRAMSARAVTMRLQDVEHPAFSKLDLHLGTGFASWKDYETFKLIILSNNPQLSLEEQVGLMKAYVLSNPANLYSAIQSFLRYPSSYANLSYRTSHPVAMEAEDGSKHIVRFRMVPAEDVPLELLSEEDQRNFWNLAHGQVDKDDTRSTDYLSEDVTERIENGGIQMKLQIMVAAEAEAENLAFFHPDAAWPGKSWRHLGTINLTSLSGDSYIRGAKTNARNMPPEMSLLPAVSPKDPNWTHAVRPKAYDASSSIREIITSTNTIEAQAIERGQSWTNHGRRFYQESIARLQGVDKNSLDVQAVMALKTGFDFCSWSPVPWTSDVPESEFDIASKIRQFATFTLKTSWDKQAPATHQTGIAVSGYFSMVPADRVPHIPFFKTNLFFSTKNIIKARFSNAGKFGKDDRAISVRGCLLKLNNGEEEIDLLFNTGSTSVFENYLTFAMNARANQALESTPQNLEGYKRWLYARPANYYNLIDMLVKGPTSYTKLRYYTKFPVLLAGSNGTEHYCKFRLVPFDKSSKIEGLLTEDDQREIWKRAAYPEDRRTKDYLRMELHHKIKSEPEVLLRLEIMTKAKTGLEEQCFFHPSADWRSPWEDLAVVKLDDVLTTDEMRNLWGAPGNLPSGLSLIKPLNSCDPNWTNYARHEIYTRNAHIREVREAFGGNPIAQYKNQFEANTTYEVEVHTGDMKYAGTDCDVHITIIGKRASTQKHYMDHWGNDFERGDKETYKFSDRHVGTIEYIIMGIDPEFHISGDSAWFLEKVVVLVNGVQTTFPHHQWVTDGTTHRNENPLILAANKTLLPGEETILRQTARLMQSLQHQEIVKWSHDLPVGETTKDVSDDFPGFLKVPGLKYNDLDPKYKWYEEHFAEYRDLKLALQIMHVGVVVKNFFDPINYYEEFKDVQRYNGPFKCESDEQKWLEDWDKDAEFGRQTLNGMNPVGIHRIRTIPDKFAVTEESLDGLLKRGLTLEEELASGHIYMVDLEILEGVSTGTYKGRQLEMAAAMALFYHEPGNDDLLPIAIQLGQKPGPDCPIWTPNDIRDDWLLAKFWYRNADAQVGQLVTHLAHTHFFIEPFAVAMHRNFSSAHPVFKMLKEHLKFIIAVDTRGREVLIAPGGAGDVSLTVGFGSSGITELLTKAYKDLTFGDFHYPNHLKKRDMMELPGYHHRDDAIALWDITFDYIKSFVNIFYDSDKAVIEDWEAQAWVKDVHHNGFGKIKNAKLPALGLPSKLDNKEELVMYLTKLVYTDTTRHSFANFYVFEYTRFAPNSPTVMRGKLPKEEDRGKVTCSLLITTVCILHQATMASVLESLPTRQQAAIACSTSRVLANYAKKEIYLTQTPSWLFEEGGKGSEAKEAFDMFAFNLAKAEVKMRARNEKLKVPYTVLYPSKIPAGISV